MADNESLHLRGKRGTELPLELEHNITFCQHRLSLLALNKDKTENIKRSILSYACYWALLRQPTCFVPRWFLQRWLLCKGPKTDLLAACFGGRFSWFSFEGARGFNDPLNLDNTFSWLLYSLAALPCPLVAPDMFAFNITLYVSDDQN